MELRNCVTCDRPFLYVGVNQCPDCLKAEQQEFEKIYRYLRDHPGASLVEVCEATGVAQSLVLKFLRQGRLQLSNADEYLRCELCGAPVREGRYCSNCARKMAQSMESTLKPPSQQKEKRVQEEKRYWYSRHFYDKSERRKGPRRETP